MTQANSTISTPRGEIATGPLRVALIGCGAIAQQMHLPVLAGHEKLKLAALVDANLERARPLAEGYGISSVLSSADQLDRNQIDAAIIATPPFHHAPCSLALMRRGFHVLVEKPMATTLADAEQMAAESRRAGVVLSVGLVRRLYPAISLLNSLIASEYFGRPRRFDIEVGGVYGWPAATLGNMLKEQSGGGVLMDMGPHMFDQLLAVMGGTAEVIEYRDNAQGGIETDCELTLRLQHRGQAVDGRVALSRTRGLRNSMQIDCERGDFELACNERYRVTLRPKALELVDPVTAHARPFELKAAWSDEKEVEWYGTFRAPVDDWVNAILERRDPQLTGESALVSMRLIDDCYRMRTELAEPWAAHPMMTATASVKSSRRVLITGATGFIGGRLAEILSRRSGYQVRALVHSPGNASRLARLPVEMVQADLNDAAAISAAVTGCDAVVHCAIGTTYGDRREIFRVTVDGTRQLLEAAKQAGVKRFVHLSTIAVHGDDVTGIIDESTPINLVKGNTYIETKVRAEAFVTSAGGIETVVFRPACVYGPFGMTFITRPIQYLAKGGLVLQNSADTLSNTVFVDNVAEALVLGLEHPGTGVIGEVFTLCDDDGMTWGDFYGLFARELGKTVRREDGAPARTNGSARRGWFRSVADVGTSSEFKSLGRKVLETDPLGAFPRFVLERTPGLKPWLLKQIGAGKPTIYSPASAHGREDVLRITPRNATIVAEKARRVLGWQPLIDRDSAMQRTLEWIRYARLA